MTTTRRKRVVARPKAGASGAKARLVERRDGYYWVAPDGSEAFGPFDTLDSALADMEVADEEGEPDAVDALADAEREFGIADWIDPDTGEPAEDRSPRIEDH